MFSSRIIVGLPLENPRRLGLGEWRKWWPPAPREPVLKARWSPAVAPPPTVAPKETLPAPDLEVQPLPLLPTRHFFILSAIVLVVVLLVWGLVRSNNLAVGLSYEISALTQEKLNLQETNRQLKTELTGVGSLAQLEEAARNVLGLVTPSQGQIVVVEP